MKICFVLSGLALLLSCSSPYDPSNFPLNEQIYVQPRRVKLNADGKDTTLIVARLPKEAGLVDVSFTISSGTFIYSGNQSDKQYANLLQGDYRFAQTILQSNTTSQDSVYITAEITQARNHTTVSFIK